MFLYGRLVTLLTSQPSTTNARFHCYPFSHFSVSILYQANSLLAMEQVLTYAADVHLLQQPAFWYKAGIASITPEPVPRLAAALPSLFKKAKSSWRVLLSNVQCEIDRQWTTRNDYFSLIVSGQYELRCVSANFQLRCWFDSERYLSRRISTHLPFHRCIGGDPGHLRRRHGSLPVESARSVICDRQRLGSNLGMRQRLGKA